jgi:hypothetical protein
MAYLFKCRLFHPQIRGSFSGLCDRTVFCKRDVKWNHILRVSVRHTNSNAGYKSPRVRSSLRVPEYKLQQRSKLMHNVGILIGAFSDFLIYFIKGNVCRKYDVIFTGFFFLVSHSTIWVMFDYDMSVKVAIGRYIRQWVAARQWLVGRAVTSRVQWVYSPGL